MTMTLSDLRQKRDAQEREEQLARYATIREKLVPLLLQDLRGELDETAGLSLLELCDDLEISESEYNELQTNARALAQDLRRASEIGPALENEKLRFCKLTLAKRRSEQLSLAAHKSDQKQKSKRNALMEYHRQTELLREQHPYFFDEAGEPLAGLVDLPLPERQSAPAVPTSNCPICLCDFPNADGQDYCSSRCGAIAEQHYDSLVAMKIIQRRKS